MRSLTGKFWLAVLCVLAAAPLAGAQAQLAGEWQGLLKTPGGDMHIAWHVTAKDGAVSSTIDNEDQGIFGVHVKSVTVDGQKLTLTVDDDIQVNGSTIHVAGLYTGTLNAEQTELKGTWAQEQPYQEPMELDFKRAVPAAPLPAVAKPAAPAPLDGTWMGALDVGAMKLRLVFKIANTGDGLTAQLQSPDQSPAWLPASAATRDGNKLTLEFKPIGATFTGTVAEDAASIDGTFTQGGNPMPLVMKRVKDEAATERSRPQNPVKPYPYREEEVTYPNPAAGNTLAATLTVPPGKGPFPAVLLIVGSGPHDRDESLMGHKPFLVLADALTRKGIVVLRADKRGIAKSTGNYAQATTADFATDAEAGVAYLRTRPEVDPKRLGLVGHSEGGVIAPIVAAEDKKIAFIVLMAGTGVPGDQILVEQGRLIEEAAGVPKEKAAQDAQQERELLTLAETEKDPAALSKAFHAKLAGKVPDAQIDAQLKEIASPWFRYFLTYDPATALAKVACPVLVLNGEKDLQVPPAQNLPPIRKALTSGGNKHFEIVEMPGLNHLFQTAKTGSIAEYAEIEETIAPVAIDKMASWILNQ
ncbi:MAG: alpha/beta fold hydrolase [Terracidiphilus sp.]